MENNHLEENKAISAATEDAPITDAELAELVAELTKEDTLFKKEGCSNLWSDLYSEAQKSCYNALPGLLARLRTAEAALAPATGEAAAASPAPAVAGEAGQWVKCNGFNDHQMAEEWTWVALPDGEVKQATWVEYWTDGMLHGAFGWHWGGSDDLRLLDPQPTHFMPKPAAPTTQQKSQADA